jgi:hypothetical protein
LALTTVGTTGLFQNTTQAGGAPLIAACVLALSLVFRSIDSTICSTLSFGTQFLWHGLNAVVLGILMKAAITHEFRKRPLHAQG